MDELIQQLTSRLGIDPSVAAAATSKAMAIVKEQAGDELFAKIKGSVPGAGEAAVAGADTAAAAGGGLLGSLGGAASSLLGGSAGGAIELGASLRGVGLDTAQMGGFLSTLIEFLQEKAGSEVVDQLLEKAPMLKSLVD